MLAAMLAMLATLVPAGGGAAAASSSSSSSEPLDDAEISRATADFYRTWPYPLSLHTQRGGDKREPCKGLQRAL